MGAQPNLRRLSALIAASCLTSAPALATTITVDSSVDSSGNLAICTLRDAIASANTNAAVGGCVAGAAGLDTIHFNIPGAGVHTIVLGAELPVISEPIFIDGYNQPGSAANSIGLDPAGAAINAQPMIEIDGNGLVGGGAVLYFHAAGSTVRGLAVGNYRGLAAFVLDGSSDIAGNFIGVRADGVTAFPNNLGVYVTPTGQGSVIGSTSTANERNLIARGVAVAGATNVTIGGNLIGTGKTGASLISGVAGSGGLSVNASAGPNTISGNVIGIGADGVGIVLSGANGTQVTGNLIGVGVGGVALGNVTGIQIDNNSGSASANLIQGNAIANSSADGIVVWDASGAGGIGGNRLDQNSIYGNGGLGIDLRASGDAPSVVTTDDPMDADTGANLRQNFPIIASAVVNAGGGVDIAFTLNSVPNASFGVSAYANPGCAGAHGEGRYSSGSASVATNASGNGSGTIAVPAPLPVGWGVGHGVTLLAVAASGDTSEFSACMPVTSGAAPPVLAITSGTPPGGTVGAVYSFTVTAIGTAPIAFSATDLPAGLTIDGTTGAMTGIPVTAGSYAVVITAANGTQPDATQSFTLTIAAAGTPVPALSEWALLMLAGLMGLFGFHRGDRESAQ